jgi:hypothetical protein
MTYTASVSGNHVPRSVADHLPIAVRAYVPLLDGESLRRWRPSPGASQWTLIFDTETATDPSQRLRFGSFQWRRGDTPERRGLLCAPDLSERERKVLANYARANDLELLTVEEFIENIFYKLAYELQATIVGFNLPFDISRIAISHSPARRRPMRGGFSFQLSPNRWWPRVQVKHLSRRAAMIRFAAPPRQRTSRARRKFDRTPVRRGFFVDIKTIGAAITSRSDTLASLAAFLRVPSQKMATDEHGARLTREYITYAINDTQVTWECYAELARRYSQHQLVRTPLFRITSEAGIGKAYLTEMGIEPWRLAQPDFPDWLTDIIMQSYFGGRSEVHSRRVLRQLAYCDFLSMYPTVCTLMGLWRFVTAKGVAWRDSADETRTFLESTSIGYWRKQLSWRRLTTLVQIAPDDDVLPVRTQYGGEAQYTIGLNHLTSDRPLWYTLADCINAKLLGGRCPKIIRTISFEPRGVQARLRPIAIAGNPEFRIDPRKDDFYKSLIELRALVKAQLKGCTPDDREALDSLQHALKIMANATSYGIFVELNVEELAERDIGLRFMENGEPCRIEIDQYEAPGRYFHPLLATLITGAARLMLGIAERLAIDNGLDWAFCDTDSMAFAKPQGMTDAEFQQRVHRIQKWFQALNPYNGAGDLLKLEDANYAVSSGKTTGDLHPLFVWAISAKRYDLFNIDNAGRPILRKASAHGLGHLLAPYDESAAPASIPMPVVPLKEIGLDRWQYDVWYRIVSAALDGHSDQPRLADLPGFNKPAASRYGSTTPDLLRWFDHHNDGKEYVDQVKPFNFLTAFQATQFPRSDWRDSEPRTGPHKRSRKGADFPRPIAPFARDPSRAAKECFDRITGDPIAVERLKTYADVLAQYHLHPEAKFLNGDYLDSGPTERRLVHVSAVRAIGKEANRWEEQFHLGYDPEAQIDYGIGEDGIAAVRARVCEAARVHGQRRLAEAARVARERLRLFIVGKATLRAKTVARLLSAISALATSADDRSQ